MSNALYLLAESDNLPAHQFLDEETITWIKLNIPDEIKELNNPLLKKYNTELKKILLYVSDIETNYKNNEVALGIHGTLHAFRVAFYTIVINREFNLGLNERLLILSGFFHDISRSNDKSDPEHGKNSAVWMHDNKEEIRKKYNLFYDANDFQRIIEAVNIHNIKTDVDYNNPYSDVLKTADALDRYRLPKVKWWIDNKYLKIKPTVEIKVLAFSLMVESEINKLHSLSLEQTIKCFPQI